MKLPPPIHEQITFLYTTDLDKSARFYEEVMGFPLKLDQGGCRIYTVTENAYLGVCQRPNAQPPGERVVIFTFVTPEVDSWYEHLIEQGVEIETPPAENPEYGIYHFFLRDPNGYLLEVQRFLEGW
ncbi:MAG: hypothetical protein MAG431_01007 [Chloroflexi bacterium]|nr:hypothetical protein [Chloroflexota bacterium]